MKKILTITALLFLYAFGYSIDQKHYNDIFQKANKAYAENNFEEAKNRYLEIVKTEYVADDLFYNLGNTYFKLGNIPSAILYYEKALKLNPSNEDASFNLSIAKTKTIDKIEPIPLFFTSKILNSIKKTFSVNGWATNTIILLFISSIAFILYYVTKNITLKKLGFSISIATFIFFLASLYFGFSLKNELLNSNNAIIFTPSVTVKSAPSVESTKLFLIHEGTKVTLLETQNEWTKIEIEDGNVGWIPSNTYQTI